MKIVFTNNESARATLFQKQIAKSGAVTYSHNRGNFHCEMMTLNRLRDGMP